MLLEIGQICPHANNCPHNKIDSCWGARQNRNNQFSCDLVNENGQIKKETYVQQNPLNKTGKMQVIME